MSDRSTDALIRALVARAAPVAPLRNPWLRAAFWLGAVIWLGLVIALFAHWENFARRMLATPDMWLNFLGGLLTAVLAAMAAFLTSVPGRSAAWAYLPAPAVALWAGASLAGMMRAGAAPHTLPEPPMHAMACIYFIVIVALPLAVLLMLLLMRARPLRPGLTAALGGLASAGAAATLLAFVHPFDATFTDLGAHAVAIALVVGGARFFGEKRLA